MTDTPHGETVLRGIGPRKPRRKSMGAKRRTKERKFVARMPQQQAVTFIPPPRPTGPAKKVSKRKGSERGTE
jgi:hypothetical protein